MLIRRRGRRNIYPSRCYAKRPSLQRTRLSRCRWSWRCPVGRGEGARSEWRQGASGSGTCIACSAGYFQPRNGSTSCEKTANGSYASAAGQAEASLCVAGTYSERAATGCTDCPAGTRSLAGASSCDSCPVGSYSAARASACTLCEPGKTSDVMAASSCTECGELASFAPPLPAGTAHDSGTD